VCVLRFGLIMVPAACAGLPAACGGHGRCREAAGGPRAAASERGQSSQPVPPDLCHHSAQAGTGQPLSLRQPGRLCPHQAAVRYTHPANATSIACTATHNWRHHMQAMHRKPSDLVGADSITNPSLIIRLHYADLRQCWPNALIACESDNSSGWISCR